jgi:hypothetical protein
VKSEAHGGLQTLQGPECNHDAHNIQKNKRQFDKSLTTTEKSQNPAFKRAKVDQLVLEILEVTGDAKSRNFYFKLAWNLPEDIIRTAISDARSEKLAGKIRKSPGAFFTDWIKTLVATQGLKMP